MSAQIPAQPKSGSTKTGPAKSGSTKSGSAQSGPPKTGPKTGPKPRPKVAPVAPADMASAVHKAHLPAPASDEWPPREWRETTRSAGQRQALYVTLAILAMFGVLVAVNIWGARNG
jgi:hypothetical protein